MADDDELYHFTGKAGDVILVNYSCAHLINANASENIRYAVYFRVRGPSFEGKVENFESFVDPLMNWNLKFWQFINLEDFTDKVNKEWEARKL